MTQLKLRQVNKPRKGKRECLEAKYSAILYFILKYHQHCVIFSAVNVVKVKIVFYDNCLAYMPVEGNPELYPVASVEQKIIKKKNTPWSLPRNFLQRETRNYLRSDLTCCTSEGGSSQNG